MSNRMQKFGAMIVVLLFTTVAFAGYQGYNGTTSIGIFDKIKCSTGLTCAKANNGVMTIVSSPTITTGALAVQAVEATNATITLQTDDSDDSGDDWQLASVASGNAFTISNDTSGSQVAKLSISTTGAVTGPGTGAMSGFLNKLVAATATTITAAQCGSTFYNSGAVQMELPEASAVLGCTITFVTLNASNFDINPDDADIILPFSGISPSTGDAVRNATLGASFAVRAMSASQWVVVGINGTYTDIN